MVLDESPAFPWPAESRGGTEVRAHEFHYASLENLPPGSRVEIYTLAHERVQVLEPSSPVVAGYVHPATAVWDGRNESGQDAAAGVYLYIITIPDQPEVRGKLALVRK